MVSDGAGSRHDLGKEVTGNIGLSSKGEKLTFLPRVIWCMSMPQDQTLSKTLYTLSKTFYTLSKNLSTSFMQPFQYKRAITSILEKPIKFSRTGVFYFQVPKVETTNLQDHGIIETLQKLGVCKNKRETVLIGKYDMLYK